MQPEASPSPDRGPDSAGSDDDAAPGRLGPLGAAAIASAVFLVPNLIAFPTSPAPNHPRVLLWYASLRKPWFKPPDVLVPLAWTAIEAALARDAYLLLRAAPSRLRGYALATLGCNVLAIGGWSALFFGRRRLGPSTVAAAAMVATGAVHQRLAARIDPGAGKAAIPFVAWVTFATALTGSIWWLNRRR